MSFVKLVLILSAVLQFFLFVDQTQIEDINSIPIVSTPDESYKLLIYLEKNPESKYFDSLIQRYVELDSILWESRKYPQPSPLSGRNNMRVFVNSDSGIFVEGNQLPISLFSDTVQKFLVSIDKKGKLPEHRLEEDINGNKHFVSKARFEIITKKENLNELQSIIKIISESILSYRSILSRDWYGKSPSELNNLELDNLNTLVWNRTRVYTYEQFLDRIPVGSEDSYKSSIVYEFMNE